MGRGRARNVPLGFEGMRLHKTSSFPPAGESGHGVSCKSKWSCEWKVPNENLQKRVRNEIKKKRDQRKITW